MCVEQVINIQQFARHYSLNSLMMCTTVLFFYVKNKDDLKDVEVIIV